MSSRRSGLLSKMCEWGNLEADIDYLEVPPAEDFNRRRSLYQLTAAGEVATEAPTYHS